MVRPTVKYCSCTRLNGSLQGIRRALFRVGALGRSSSDFGVGTCRVSAEPLWSSAEGYPGKLGGHGLTRSRLPAAGQTSFPNWRLSGRSRNGAVWVQLGQ